MRNNPYEPRILNDFKPECRALIDRLTRAGFTIVRGSNGEEGFRYEGDMAKFLENLTACDEGHLYVRPPGDQRKEGASCHTLYLVFGNSPGELVCDYSEHSLLDEVTMAHNEEWTGKDQPTVGELEVYGVRRVQQMMSHLFVENLND